MAGSKELSRHLQTLKDVKNLNPQKPLSILVELKVMIEKLDMEQGRMIAYEDFLTTEYRLIRAQMRRIETRLMVVAKTREGLSDSIRSMQGTVNRTLNTFERFVKACESIEFQPLDVLERIKVPDKVFLSLNPNEQILHTEQADKRRRIIESFLQDLEEAQEETRKRNELKAMEEVLIGLHREIDREAMQGSDSTKKLVSGFTEA